MLFAPEMRLIAVYPSGPAGKMPGVSLAGGRALPAAIW
jgi:hypothetical protein